MMSATRADGTGLPQQLELRWRAPAEGVAILHVRGELDLAHAPATEASLRSNVDGGSDAVVIDLSECTFMDSSGLRAVLVGRDLASGRPGEHREFVIVASPGSQVARLFELTKLSDYVTIVESLPDAMRNATAG